MGNISGLSGDGGTGSSNQRYNPTEAKLKITQNYGTFGEAKAGIENSKLGVAQADLGIWLRKTMRLKPQHRFISGCKLAHTQYKLALEAEAQLKRQTGQQDFRVSRGAAVGQTCFKPKMH